MNNFLHFYNYHVCVCNVMSKFEITTLVPDLMSHPVTTLLTDTVPLLE